MLVSLCLACAVETPANEVSSGDTSRTPSPAATPRLNATPVNTPTPAPVLEPPAGTGVLLATPRPAAFSQSCLAEASGTPRPTQTPTPASTATPVPSNTPGPSPTPRPTVAPIEPFGTLPLDEDAKFKNALLDILGDDKEHYAFEIKDLRTGRGAQHNP